MNGFIKFPYEDDRGLGIIWYSLAKENLLELRDFSGQASYTPALDLSKLQDEASSKNTAIIYFAPEDDGYFIKFTESLEKQGFAKRYIGKNPRTENEIYAWLWIPATFKTTGKRSYGFSCCMFWRDTGIDIDLDGSTSDNIVINLYKDGEKL